MTLKKLNPVACANPQKRFRQGSLLEMASKQDQKLVQRILEVLKTHNGHFRRLSWTNHSRYTESTTTADTQGSLSSTCEAEASSSHHRLIPARPTKRSRRVTFRETNEVRFITHEETDYGLPMMSAIPGTGNGITNPNSEWHNRPHTGWYNKYVGANDRPRWWFYDCEQKEQATADTITSPPHHTPSLSLSPGIQETPSKAAAAATAAAAAVSSQKAEGNDGGSNLDDPLCVPARRRRSSKKRKRAGEDVEEDAGEGDLGGN